MAQKIMLTETDGLLVTELYTPVAAFQRDSDKSQSQSNQPHSVLTDSELMPLLKSVLEFPV